VRGNATHLLTDGEMNIETAVSKSRPALTAREISMLAQFGAE
jgi:hypothetical protein